jgi:hypothetical protein
MSMTPRSKEWKEMVHLMFTPKSQQSDAEHNRELELKSRFGMG